MKGLRNRRVLITGGASGIGEAAVRRFLGEGSRVAVLDRNTDGLARIRRNLPAIEAALPADVASLDDVRNAFRELDNLWGGLDVLVNNAGISIRHRFLDIQPDEWHRVLNTNLNGVFYMAQQASKRMVGTGGVIINMGSTNALVGQPFYADYNASKAGVVELTRSMALELAPSVRVLAVCPGYVLTPMQKAEYTPEMLEEVNRKIPLGRHCLPEEVAALFAFLASDECPYITGQCVVVDGGETAGGLASR